MGPSVVKVLSDCFKHNFCQSATGNKVPREEFGLRVAKGHGTREYGSVRISVVSDSIESPAGENNTFFEHSAQFKYRWTNLYIHSTVKKVTPGHVNRFQIGNRSVSVSIPRVGEGTAGLLIADPCFQDTSITSLVGCTYSRKYKLAERLPALLNAFVASPDIDYWGILGDNFYDRTGAGSTLFYSMLNHGVKEKPLVTVPGNHDYWILGSPRVASRFDQCGNGHMQFYAMDSEAAARVPIGSNSTPFNFSVNPQEGILAGCNLASPDNSRYFQQLGNVGIVAQSGAFAYQSYDTFVADACQWLATTPGIEVGVLVGHWDNVFLGVQKDMDMPHFYDRVSQVPGCAKLASAGNLKYVMGHTHCNLPHPHFHVDIGFMVAGQGMTGCGNFGMPVLDTTEGRTRFYYFDTSSEERYKAVMDCVPVHGWRACVHLAEVWLDQLRHNESLTFV
eukprot:TRINITY_DN74599_c0_g1_i2.p1 TRINITY_DN74599_c0_g1~~TRINITY_DN74599_c0_g1_i2.p1  ORF type:complete len:520 (-),score=45.90 TRINITY_DN74599_c0_g1_i2:135-1478(-)